MPPKNKISKDEILEKAYEMIKTNGYEYLTARNLAKELNCSTQPIYKAFTDMNDLKKEIIMMAAKVLQRYIENNQGEPAKHTSVKECMLCFQFLSHLSCLDYINTYSMICL